MPSFGDPYLDTTDLRERMEQIADDKSFLDDDDDFEFLALCRELSTQIDFQYQYGHQMILEDEFVEYAQELAYDIGAASRDASWPPIDWDEAAELLKQDYTSVSVDQWEYLMREN